MINSGLIFEMLSYSIIEAGFHEDQDRIKLCHGIIKRNFHSKSPLLREAIIFNRLLNGQVSSDEKAITFIHETLDQLPDAVEVRKPYDALIKDLERNGVLQELEDTFVNLDNLSNNKFSVVSYVIDGAYAEFDESERPVYQKSVEMLTEHLKNTKVEKRLNPHTFRDKVGLLGLVMRKKDLTVEEETLLTEIFSSDKPVVELLNLKFSSIEEELNSKGKTLTELGTFGKVTIGAAVIALLIKKFNEIRTAIEKASRDQVLAIKGIRLENAVTAYADFEQLLTEMEAVIQNCED